MAGAARPVGRLRPVAELDLGEQVDHAILRHRIAARLFSLDELTEYRWNPLMANPGTAIHLLLARDFAPLPERLRAVGGRLAAIPASLAAARADAEDLPEVHVSTAVGQFTGTRTLLATELERSLRAAQPTVRSEVEPALEGRAPPRSTSTHRVAHRAAGRRCRRPPTGP